MGLIDQMMANIYKPPKQEKQTTVLPKGFPTEKTAGTPDQSVTQGQILNGEVLDLRTSQILVLLENGMTVSARTEGTLNLSIGQQASFIVAQTSEDQILLKLAANDTPAENPMIDKALQAAHIQKTERSISIVSELLSHQQPVQEATLRHYLSLSSRYPELPVKDLILMELHHIPVTRENVAQFVHYQSRQAQLLGQVQDLTKELFTAINQLSQGESQKEFLLELRHLLAPKASYTLPETRSEVFSETAAENRLPGNTASMPETSVMPETAAIPEDADRHAPLTDAPNPPDTANAAAPSVDIESPLQTTDSSRLPLPKDTAENILWDNDFLSSFLLEPKDIADPQKVQRYYEELQEKVTKLEQLSQRLAENNIKTSSDAPKQIKQNLSFMDAINNVFPYIQLPLKFKDSPAHGELYVYEKKKSGKPSDSLSALLHLELEALGTTDIFITLAGNHVTVRFSMTDKEAELLVCSELPVLSEALASRGYTLKSEVTVREPEVLDSPCLLEQFLEEHAPNQLTRYSFDIRA